MIDAFKGASGKLCGHSDMGATYVGRTGKTYSHKLCNKRNLESLPYSEKELSQQEAFKSRSTVISQTMKSLTDDQRKALIRLRNDRGVYSYRQLIEGIYDKKTKTVPATALAELVAQGMKSGTTSSGGGTTPSGGGSSSELG